MRVIILLACVCAFACAAATAGPTCLDESGTAVDWWIALKFPKQSDSSNTLVQNGVAHAFITSAQIAANPNPSSFTPSMLGVDSASSLMGRTLTQVFKNKDSPSYVWLGYNDQTPDGTTSSARAHAKGALAATSTGGFWLVHSVPDFVDLSGSAYSYPDNGVIYGQSFMCLTLGAGDLDEIAYNLQIYDPLIFASSSISSALTSVYPNLAALLSGTRQTASGLSKMATVHAGSTAFTHFAKNAKWGKDLYASLVAPNLKGSLFVETWMRPFEPSIYPSSTIPYEVINVNTISEPKTGITWKETNDHSKWAISIFPRISAVCVGGINKQTSQHKRGGGTVCMINPAVHRLFSALIVRSTLESYTAPTGADNVYPDQSVMQETSSASAASSASSSAARARSSPMARLTEMLRESQQQQQQQPTVA